MNKVYKYTLSSGEKKEITFDVGVHRLAVSNANGEDGAGNISKMKDIELTDLQNKQILVYDSANEKWKNENQLSAGNGLIIEDGIIKTNADFSLSEKPVGKDMGGGTLYRKCYQAYNVSNGTTIPINVTTEVARFYLEFGTVKDANGMYPLNNTDISISLIGSNLVISTSNTYSALYISILYVYKDSWKNYVAGTTIHACDINGGSIRDLVVNFDDIYFMQTVLGSNFGFAVCSLTSHSNAFTLSGSFRTDLTQPLTLNGHTIYVSSNYPAFPANMTSDVKGIKELNDLVNMGELGSFANMTTALNYFTANFFNS